MKEKSLGIITGPAFVAQNLMMMLTVRRGRRGCMDPDGGASLGE